MVSKALVVGAYQRKAEEIARLGVNLTVLIPTSWKDRRGQQVAERLHTVGYSLQIVPICLNGQYHLHFYPTLRRELAQIRPDILHMDEEPYNLATWQALGVAESLGIRTLFFTWQNLNRLYPPPFRWIEKHNYQRAARALAGNQEACSVLRQKGYRRAVEVIPQFGVDPSLFFPVMNSRQWENGPLRIGYAGGLLPEKGLMDLLRACAALRGNWTLSIVGEGSEKASLQAFIHEKGLSEKVTIAPRRSSGSMPEYYQTLDVLVLPSRTQSNWKEQFGRVLIEAMACQVAVVGSTCGEIPNVIHQSGLVYDEGQWSELAQCLQQLMDNPTQREVLAKSGRRRILENFTMSRVAQNTVDVYRTMMRS
ncbi:MAG: glycosyltransferase [Chloroflexota bacterium]